MLAEMPRMMREIVESAVRSQPDMEIVAVLESDDTVEDAVARSAADVAIVALDGGDGLRAFEPLLYRHPRLQLVAVIDDGRGALLSELRPHHSAIDDVTALGLVQAIRASARAGAV